MKCLGVHAFESLGSACSVPCMFFSDKWPFQHAMKTRFHFFPYAAVFYFTVVLVLELTFLMLNRLLLDSLLTMHLYIRIKLTLERSS